MIVFTIIMVIDDGLLLGKMRAATDPSLMVVTHLIIISFE